MDILFLVPARGGSKGVIDKNLRSVGGIPLVGRACRTASMAAARIPGAHRVICSTDATAIAEIAARHGAEIPFSRPALLASDTASSMDVILHALDALGGAFDALVLLQPTSPLITPDDVVGAVQTHLDSGCSVVGVCPVEHPLEWSLTMDGEGRVTPVVGDRVTRRQDARATYRLNGAVYVASVSQLRRAGSFLTETTRGYVMPPERSVDIDGEVDIAMATGILEHRAVEPFTIGARAVGPGHPCYVIAEAGVNHNGSLDTALRLVEEAARAGADAVKFQTFVTEEVVARDAPKAAYQRATTGEGGSQFDMVKGLELSRADHEALLDRARAVGIQLLSTPFDEPSVHLLVDLGLPALKVSSGDLTTAPLLRAMASTGLPLVISTGMGTIADIDRALAVVASAGAPPFALLHCVSAYPAAPEEVDLASMETLRHTYGVPTGFSDHTEGIEIALAAVARGASIVEKHFTLDRTMPGPDHRASIEPDQLASLVEGIRKVEAARGKGDKRPRPGELDTMAVARRSVVAVRALPEGHVVQRADLGYRRPSGGIPPGAIEGVVGRRLREEVAEGAMIRWEALE